MVLLLRGVPRQHPHLTGNAGRYIVTPHFSRWAVRDLGNYDADAPLFTHRWQADDAARRKNDNNAARINPTPTLFDKDEPMTEPSIWDELDGGDFRRVPEGEVGAGSPLITPIGGGEPVRYRRATSYIEAVEDDYSLKQWRQHLTVDGFLVDGNANPFVEQWEGADWKTRISICGQAFEAAGGYEKANRGTRMHSLTDILDAGDALPSDVTPEEHADLDAYREAVAPFTLVHSEVKTVHDGLAVAGTPDRVWEYQGRRYIGDLKTGKIDGRKCAMQTALYSRSKLYDVKTGERTALDVDQDRALIVHLPYGEAKARVLWVDIKLGWDGVQLCEQVYAWRKVNGLTSVFKAPAVDDPILAAIGRCQDPPSLTALWACHKAAWTDTHTAAAKARLGELAA